MTSSRELSITGAIVSQELSVSVEFEQVPIKSELLYLTRSRIFSSKTVTKSWCSEELVTVNFLGSYSSQDRVTEGDRNQEEQ